MNGLSAGGRRLRDRFPLPLAVAAVVGQVVAVVVWSFGGDEPAGAARPDDGKVEITYIVTGDRPSADIKYDTPTGSEDHEALPLPFKATYRFDEGDTDVMLMAQNPSSNGRGNVMCTIVADGKVVKQSSGSGEGAIATCSGVAGEDKPIPGATIPQMTAPTPPKGEVRLTKVVRVKRYQGRGSPVVRRVTDGDARLSYAELGGEWGPSRRTDPVLEGYDRKQSFDTDRSWEALIASGLVDGDLLGSYKGPGGLRAVASAFLDGEQRTSFPDLTTGRDVASQPVKVSGRPGWVLVREMHYDKEGVRSKMDLCAVVVVHTGRPRPSFLWFAIPESYKRLWPDVNTLIGSVQVG